MYSYPEVFADAECTWLQTKCSEPQHEVVRIKMADDYRGFCQLPKGSHESNLFYALGAGVERGFGRLMGFWALNYLDLSGLDKVELPYGVSVIVIQAIALGKPNRDHYWKLEAILERLPKDTISSVKTKPFHGMSVDGLVDHNDDF